MFHRLIAVAVTVFALGALLAPVPADAQPGHWRTEEEFLRDTGPEWQPIAPGVYELRRESGRVTQVGFGVESFRWALDEARAEQAELLAKAGGPGIDEELHELDRLVAYLEESVARAEAERAERPARLSAKASAGGYTCGGVYSLNVSFSCDIASGSTTSTATWNQFAPSAYQKTLYTYARAAQDSSPGSPASEYADSKTFGNVSQEQVQAHAGYYSFTPVLKGRAIVSVYGGCADERLVFDELEC